MVSARLIGHLDRRKLLAENRAVKEGENKCAVNCMPKMKAVQNRYLSTVTSFLLLRSLVSTDNGGGRDFLFFVYKRLVGVQSVQLRKQGKPHDKIKHEILGAVACRRKMSRTFLFLMST